MQNPPHDPLVFDGHNDVLARLWRADAPDKVSGFLQGDEGHINLPKARAGGLGGGFFAIFVPSDDELGSVLDEMRQSSYDIPLPSPLPHERALKSAWEQVSILKALEAAGALKICTTVESIASCLKTGQLAAIMHMEGAEAIDPEFETLEAFHAAGLRSIGPVWSRPTAFGEGVPFRFPSSPDTGGGLTDLGKKLVRECNSRGILVDVSHLTEAGFWDVAGTTNAPIVATHSNAHAVAPHSRSLTDRQLAAIAESNGIVGVNFATALMREDGRMLDDTPLAILFRHLDHLIGMLGETGVALGSDFDGAIIPKEIGDASGLPALRLAMIERGYGEALIERLCWRNWLDLLQRTWKPD
jgi:membrane dipeptidase